MRIKPVWFGLVFLLAALLPISTLAAQARSETYGGGSGGGMTSHDDQDSLFRTPLGAVPVDTTVTLRFASRANDDDAVTLRVWDERAQEQTLLPMQVVTTTPGGEDLWEASLNVGKDPTILWYRFIVQQANGQVVYYEDDTRPSSLNGAYDAGREGGSGTAYTTSPDLSWQITVYDPDFYTPEWMRNAVIYQIFPDRFRDGDPSNDPADDSLEFYDGLRSIFHETWNEPPVDPRQPGPDQNRWNVDFFGGDLAGITDKLDYLQALGVTAIYLNPIFEARSNHRYDTADFKQIDPMLSTLEDFQKLVAEADKRGIVLILDGVFNHMSSDSPAFDRYGRYDEVGACESLDSPYRLWFFFVPPKGQQPSVCVDNPQGATYYTSWAGYDSIPKLNSDYDGVRLYVFLGRNSVVNTWGREGIGGWRLDVGGDIDSGGPASDYWEGFRVAVRNANPEGVIIGEEWGNASKWLLGSEWDSVMNYRLRRGILGFVRDETYTDNDANGDNVIYAMTPTDLDRLIRDLESDYPPMAYHAMMNILDSHDTSRLLFVAGDKDRQRLAALIQFALPGAPTIYYGDEIGINAPSVDDNGTLQDDPYNRAPYPWPDASGSTYGPADEDMLSFYQTLSALRHANPALREGELITLLTDDETGVYAFLRLDRATGNAALVAVNKSEAAQTVELDIDGLIPNDLTLNPALGVPDQLVTTFDMGAGTLEIKPNQVAFVLNKDTTTLFRHPFEPGSHTLTKGDYQVTVYSTAPHAYAMMGDDAILVLTQDNESIKIEATATFQLYPAQVNTVYQRWQGRIEDDLLRPMLRSQIRETAGLQTFEQIWADTSTLEQWAEDRLRALLAAEGLELLDLRIEKIMYSAEHEEQNASENVFHVPVQITVPAHSGSIWTGTAETPFVAPQPPANVAAQGENSGVILTWDAAPDASAYVIYRSPVAVGGFEPLNVTTEPGYIDESTVNGYKYYYAIASVSADGLIGDLSASLPAIPSAPISSTAYLMEDVPDAVTLAYGLTTTIRASVTTPETNQAPNGMAFGVRAEAALVPADADLGAISSWVPMSYTGEDNGADVYEATIPVTAAGDYVQIARFTANAGETWTVVTLPDGTWPPLTVAAPDDTTAPEAPAAVSILEASLDGVIVTWEASPSEDVATYRVYRTLEGETQVIAEVPAGDDLRYHDKAVAPGNRYRYAISAVDASLNESEAIPTEEATVERRAIPVTFTVTVPDYTKEGEGDVYIAGDFGTDTLPFWDPAGILMTQLDDQHWTVTLEIPEGAKLQYKYARGTWDAVEKGAECEEIANRTLTVEVPEGQSELLVDGDVIAKWRDLDKCG